MKTAIRLTKKIFLLCIALSAFFAAVFAVRIKAAFSANAEEVNYTFETVPAESIVIASEGDIEEIQPRQSFNVIYEISPWYTTTPKLNFHVIPENAASVTNLSEVRLNNGKAQGKAEITVSESAEVGSGFNIIAGADGVESNRLELTVSKIPVKGLSLSSAGSDDKLYLGKTRTVIPEIVPSYATVKNVRYELSGSGMKYIDSFDESTGTIKAKSSIDVLDVNASVTVTAYSVDNPNAYDSITLSLYKPSTVLEISATTSLGFTTEDGYSLAVANSREGDTVDLHAQVNGTNVNGLNYIVAEGWEYIENGIVQSNGSFTLRSTSEWTEEMKIPHPRIKIKAAYSDGFDEICISVYVPVERITFVHSAPTNVENYRSYDLQAKALPEYATLLADNANPILYSLNGIDSSIAEISSEGMLKLPKSLTSKGSVIEYSASLVNARKEVDASPLTHELTIVPVYAESFQSVSIMKNGLNIETENVTVLPSDELFIDVTYTTDNVTETDVVLYENSNMLTTERQTVFVARLSEMEENFPYLEVTVKYEHEASVFSETCMILIYVPAETAEIADAVFERDKALDLNKLITINGHGFASNHTITWGSPIISSANNGITAVCENGFLSISSKANAGTVVKVPYRTFDGSQWQYKEFTVAPLSGSFTLEYGKTFNHADNREYEINYSAPQLEEGHSVDLYLKYNGLGGKYNFGLSYSIDVSLNADLKFVSDEHGFDKFCLSANPGESGRDNYIFYEIIIKDGNAVYRVYTDSWAYGITSPVNLSMRDVSIFKRIGADVRVNNAQITGGAWFVVSGWDDDVTFNREDLVLTVSGGKVDENRLTSCPESGFILTVSAQQTYNHATIAFSSQTTYYAILYYDDTNIVSSIYILSGNEMYIQNGFCRKNDYIQIGWSKSVGGGIDYEFNAIYRGNQDLKLYPVWTPVRAVQNKANEIRINDSGDYSYSENVNLGFNISELKKYGYKQICITILFDCKEINDGYQDLRIYAYGSSELLDETTEDHDKGDKVVTYTETFEVLFDRFATNSAAFYIGWGAHGLGNDDWVLGVRTITVTAE